MRVHRGTAIQVTVGVIEIVCVITLTTIIINNNSYGDPSAVRVET